MTPALPHYPLRFPTSTPKPRAEGSSPSAPAKKERQASACLSFFVVTGGEASARGACRASPPKRRLWRMQRGGDGAAVGDWQGGPAAADRAGHRKRACEASSSPSAPATKPAKTLGFRRFSFRMCCTVMWCTLVQTLAFSLRFYPFSTVLIPSSTQNAPSFAFFGLFRVRFPLFCCFPAAKFLPWFLCILPHSVYKLKPSVIPCRREVSFLT